MGIQIGYARVSTNEQVAGFEAQLGRLRNEKCGRIFSEQLSSRSTERPELERAIDYIRDGDGDTLVVCKLDRLARSVHDALEIVERLRAKGASLKVLDSPLDMTTPTGQLIFSVLAAIAQFERDLMLERQREGIAKAKTEGKYPGQPPHAKRKAPDVLRLRAEGKTSREIADTLKISTRSIARILADNRARNMDLPRGISADRSDSPGA